MRYRDLLEWGEIQLEWADGPDARLLLEDASGLDYSHLLLCMRDEVPAWAEQKYRDFVKKRQEHIPLQQIVGYTEFMGYRFRVTPDVLCPRQDTEILVERVCSDIKRKAKILDLCTGSGCIAISLAKLLDLGVTATDLSEAALLVARENAEYNSAEVSFFHGDLYDALPAGSRFDVIVSNPPYIKSAQIEALSPEVREFEPRMALDGSADGLLFYRRIIEKAGEHLCPGGRLYLEIGYDQAKPVTEILRRKAYEDICIYKDHSGHDRLVTAHIQEAG